MQIGFMFSNLDKFCNLLKTQNDRLRADGQSTFGHFVCSKFGAYFTTNLFGYMRV